MFKTATGNRAVQLLPEGKVRWTYRESKTGQHTSLKVDPLELMSRLLQHTLPPSFARVRTFGWLHPAAKVRGNRVRALLREKPLLTGAEEQTWNAPEEMEPELPPPRPCRASLPGLSAGHAPGGIVDGRRRLAFSQTTAMKLTLPPIHYLVKRDRNREPVDSVRGLRFTPDGSLASDSEVSSNSLKAGSGHNPEPMRRSDTLEYLIVRLDLQNFPQRPFCYRTTR